MLRSGLRGRLGALVVAGLLIVAADTRGVAGDDTPAWVAGIPGELHRLTSAGRWRTDDATGFYRVVVLRGGYEHIVERLYVQWLREGDSENPPRVVASVGIAEINDAGPYTLSHSLRAVATNKLSIAVNARHVHTGRRQQLVVVAAAPGLYSVRAPDAR